MKNLNKALLRNKLNKPGWLNYFVTMPKHHWSHSFMLLACLMLVIPAGAQRTEQKAVKASGLIPKPLHCIDKPGVFMLTAADQIFAPLELEEVAGLLSEQLQCNNPVVRQKEGAAIVLSLLDEPGKLGDEGYELIITPENIEISASTKQGAIRAVFSLLQLQLLQPDRSRIPCAEISDSPRFAYRGMHLDVSRNFYPLRFVKKYLDLMAMYKFNTFHWHLTDGAGWRLEIKKYPLLTQKAAFRSGKTWKEWWNGDRKYSNEGDPNAYGGYYTQHEAREIVEYAARLGITVIPEIEMPGHSEEVTAVYPELSCSGEPYQNGEVCIGNPQTYRFFEDVLTEVMAIFPSTYIHVGGDEASTKSWAKCPKCQKLKQEEGLENEHQLQSYLIKHMEKFLKEHDRKLLGWDEIIEGGLPPDATVMSWRGMKGGITAVREGHDVVMTPGETYLDAYQSDPTTQPEAIGGFLPISRVYNFEPVPAELSAEQAKHILGTQANLWAEYMPTTYHLEYMAYPRALALAEVAWTAKDKKDFDDFHRRLQAHYRLLQRKSVNYYRPSTFLTVLTQPDYKNKRYEVSFQSEQYQPEIHYTTDGTMPTANSPRYSGPFYTSGKTEIKAAIFSKGELKGGVTEYTADYHKAVGKKVIFNTKWDHTYPAQKEQTLTNGIKGSITYSDQQWLGYLKDFDATVDMESRQPVSSVSIRFMHQPGPGVHLPGYVELQFSDNGKDFVSYKKLTHNIQPDNPALIFKTFTFDCSGTEARFIRLVAPNVMNGYMFVDEIIVY